MILPPHLFPGARIALVAPAGPVDAGRVDGAVARCRALGLEPVLGSAALERNGYLAGDDARRAADLQRAIDDPDIDGIWALRGGYGTMRLLPLLDLTPLVERPKPFIGFSDNTALHLALARLGVVSYHGPHPMELVTPTTDACFRRVLFEPAPPGPLPLPEDGPPVRTLVAGVAEGPLVGGNLALAAAVCGTPAAMTSEGKIVFLEDVGEPVYRLDRMLMQLRLAGALDGAVGLALGRFTEVEPQRSDRPMEALFLELAESLGVPAVLGLPIGHAPDNWTVPLGVRARLDAGAGTLSVVEPAVGAST
ncbi:MAG: LD-carboxypeptidase [Gemmatimonadetes bacterium]|nr:LD-carboxypeptidase [Gemmatimonadota bacterium]